MIKEFLIVGLGGAIGSMLRYTLKLLAIYLNFSGFWGTLSANILGSFLIGVALSSVEDKALSLFVIVGIMGGFTTFSTFSSETVSFFQNGEVLKGIGYLTLSLASCLLLTYLGLLLGKKF